MLLELSARKDPKRHFEGAEEMTTLQEERRRFWVVE